MRSSPSDSTGEATYHTSLKLHEPPTLGAMTRVSGNVEDWSRPMVAVTVPVLQQAGWQLACWPRAVDSQQVVWSPHSEPCCHSQLIGLVARTTRPRASASTRHSPVCSARARQCTDRAHRAAHRSTSTENQVYDAQRLTRVRRFLRVCVGCVHTFSYCIRHIKCIICISYGMLQLVPWRYAPVVPPVDRVMSHPPVRVQHSTKVVRTSGVCMSYAMPGGRAGQSIHFSMLM